MVHVNVDKFKSQQLQLHLNYMKNSELFKFTLFTFQCLHYIPVN